MTRPRIVLGSRTLGIDAREARWQDRRMVDGAHEGIPLSTGKVARIVELDDGWALEVDGIRQSHVGAPGAAPALAVTRWMLAAVGGGPPVAAAHLGGALLSLPRALAATRPGSTQTVVELEPALVALLDAHDLVPPGTTVELGDARAWIEAAPPARLDLVTIDVFAGGRIPPAFTSLECFRAAHAALAPSGMLVVNSVAGGDLGFTWRELATMRATFEHVAFVVQGSALAGLRFGNAVLIGSDAPIDADRIRSRLRGDTSKGALVTELDEHVGDARPATDADALWSPEPDLPSTSAALQAVESLEGMARSAASIMAARSRDVPREPS